MMIPELELHADCDVPKTTIVQGPLSARNPWSTLA